MKKVRIRTIVFGCLFLVCTFLIVFSATRSQQTHIDEGGFISNLINIIFFGERLSKPELENIVNSFLAKFLGHFSLFALDSLFFILFLRSLNVSKIKIIISGTILGLCLASLGEILEIFASERVSSLNDVILNYAGFLLPSFLIFMNKK